jgi:thiol-disulfide isomerase/thioredoxin
MKLLLLAAFLIAFLSGFSQLMSIYDYPPVKKFKVNLFTDKETGRVYDIKIIDSIGKSGQPVQISSVATAGDTANWTIAFTREVKPTETPLYKKQFQQPFPAYTLKDIEGHMIKSSDLIGKTVLINFWSISCGPCIAEMPMLNRMVDSLGNKNIYFLAFALDGSDELVPFLKKHPFKYTIIPDAGKFADEVGVSGYPTNLLIDGKGVVVSVIEGIHIDKDTHEYLTRREIEHALDHLENR